MSGPKKRWQKREREDREEGENEKRGSNGCTIPFFHFLSSCVPKMALLNHKMLQCSPLTLPCVWHRSGRGSLTPIAGLNVCCGVPVINARYRHPRSHVLTGGTQRQTERKWYLKFGENRVAQRDRWWKALRNLRGIEKGCTISFQRRFLFSAFDATEKSFTWWWKLNWFVGFLFHETSYCCK